MTTPNINELLRNGIEEAREGNRAAARDLLQQVVDLDDKNEKGWFWLASVVDTDEERRVCLSNVLHINPNNEKARKAMDALEAKQREKVNSEEVIPGITRRALTLILGGGILVVLLIVVIFAATSISNNNRIAAENAAQTQVVVLATSESGTRTQAVIAGTATQRAIATETFTPSPTSNIATLPPTWTLVPNDTDIPTAAPLPPVTGLRGLIAAVSGRDVLSNDFLPFGYFNLDSGGRFTQVSTRLGRHPSIAASGQRMVYSRYDDVSFSSVLEQINLNGTQPEGITPESGGDLFLQSDEPSYSADGQRVAFVAVGSGSQYPQIHIYNAVDGSVQKLTEVEGTEYRYPQFSPDGVRILAIRVDIATAVTGPDIVSIDIATGVETQVSSDKDAFLETFATWTIDGQQVVYIVAPSNDPQNTDLLVRNADGSGVPLPFLRQAGAESYPVFSPDGQHLAFSSNRTGFWDIYIYGVADQSLAQLTSSEDDDFASDWWQQPQ